MKKYGVGLMVLFFAVSCILIGANSVSAQEIKLKYANFFPPMHKISAVAEEWCKEIEKRTNGRVKLTYHPGGTLIPAAQSYEGAVKDIADVVMMTQQYNAGRFPMTEAMYLPLGGIKRASQATNLINAWYDKFKPKEYDDTKVLYLFCGGPGQLATLKPLASINDIKGLKIRAAGDSAKIVSALGGVPVSIPLADSYEGFQRGVIAGSILPTESLKGWKFGDLLKGIQLNPAMGYPSALGVVMNKAKWNSLPPDIQKVFEQVSKEWIIKTGVAWDEIDKEGIEYAVSKGAKVSTVSKEEEAITAQKMKPLLDEYVANMKKLGLPGDESMKFILDYIKKNP